MCKKVFDFCRPQIAQKKFKRAKKLTNIFFCILGDQLIVKALLERPECRQRIASKRPQNNLKMVAKYVVGKKSLQNSLKVAKKKFLEFELSRRMV